jgi:serine/threonine protein phosphatase 1
MFIIGDVHGCYDILMELVKQLPPNSELAFTGDLIDRGPKSSAVIDFVKENNHYCVMGNHEDMCLLYHDGHDGDVWSYNGGRETLASYIDERVSDDHLNFLRSLPLYLEFPSLILPNGRHLVVSHSTVAYVWESEPHDSRRFKDEVLWERSNFPRDVKGIYNVFGHNPQWYGPTVKEHFACVDTGCVYNHNQHKILTALEFPSLKEISVPRIDKVYGRL